MLKYANFQKSRRNSIPHLNSINYNKDIRYKMQVSLCFKAI